MASAPSAPSARYQLSDARRIVSDLLHPNPWIYWGDLLLTITVAYSAATVFLTAPFLSPLQIASYIVAGFGLFRTSLFMHEVIHFRRGEMVAFKVAWNILAGIPMLMPSFLYQCHLTHHNTHHYGTGNDGEYLPLGGGKPSHILRFFSQVFLFPIMVTLRFLIVTPISFLNPRVRRLVLRRMSSFVINLWYIRTIPANAPRAASIAAEIACFLRATAMFVALGVGLTHWTRIVGFYALAVLSLGLNHLRTLVAHRYLSTGEEMSHAEQLDDSINITGWAGTELLFPVGLRYHALHHLFPSIPYHNLGVAHRRLMEQLPSESAYHKITYPSYWSALSELVRNARAASTSSSPPAALWYSRRQEFQHADVVSPETAHVDSNSTDADRLSAA